MKHVALAFTLALGVVAPGLAVAANSADNGNAIYERDLALWSGAGLEAVAPRLVSKRVCLPPQKARFAYDSIYTHDVAQWSGSGPDVRAPQQASRQSCLIPKRAHLALQKQYFAYDNIYARDLAIAS